MAYFRQMFNTKLTHPQPFISHLYPSSNFSFLPIYCQGESRCFGLPCASRLKQGSRSEGGRTHRFDWAKWGRQRWTKSIGLNRPDSSHGERSEKLPPFPQGSGGGSGKRRPRDLSFSEKWGGGRSAVVQNLGSICLFGTLNIYICLSFL